MRGISHKILSDTGTEPLSLVEAKLYLRVQHNLEDTEITQLIVSARKYAEHILGIFLTDKLIEESFASFPTTDDDYFQTAHPVSVLTSIEYTDELGIIVSLDLAKVEVDDYDPRVIKLITGESWPTASTTAPYPVRIVYNTVATVDDGILKGIKKDIGEAYERKEDSVEEGTRYSVAKVYRTYKKYRF